MNTQLVVLAGGLGTRFGGNKTFAALGPQQEFLLEFTLFDARRAGIGVAVLVVPPGASASVRAELEPRISGLELRFVEQDKRQPYPDLATPERERPWGTGHAAAIGCLEDAECCVVVNADDWYGPSAITDLLATAFGAGLAASDAALVTWPLESTLSRHGRVNRGICTTAGLVLDTVNECYEIGRNEGGAIAGRYEHERVELEPDAPVSLNCWALRRPAIEWLRQQTRALVTTHRDDPRLEAQLPTILMNGIRADALTIHAHAIGTHWSGVTFKDDAEFVRQQLAAVTATGSYPSPLWSAQPSKPPS